MTSVSGRLLYWTPRALSIAFLGFLSLFAMDVFDDHRGFWSTLLALTMHLLPVIVLLAVLLLAWRWEWVGAALYGLAGGLYVAWAFSVDRPIHTSVRIIWTLTIAGPAFLIAALFLANWLKRDELRAARR